MLSGIWGKKIGMTQVFSEKNAVVPVTVIDFDNWYITNVKTAERDGYDAIQVGLLKDRFVKEEFKIEWLKKPKVYFSDLREIKLLKQPEVPFEPGQKFDAITVLGDHKYIDVFGITKGRGFQGVVKRHGFSGGRASHGPRFGRWPGSIGEMRSQGKVRKGKELPGRMGVKNRMMKDLEVVRVQEDANIALIKGSVPGFSGSLVFMQTAS